jgi:sulfopyruvate decarboxylase TPP-binding subunit
MKSGHPCWERELSEDQHTSDGHDDWPNRIHAVFKRFNVKHVGHVPDTGHAQLLTLCRDDNEINDVVLTTEAEGAPLVLGAALGGQRTALLMQSSGVGNCINTFSLLKNCGAPCVIIVTMRGEFNDFNPWQVPMGSITEDTLKLCGFHIYRIDHEADVEDVVAAACDMAFGGNLQAAVLLSQRMINRMKGGHH